MGEFSDYDDDGDFADFDLDAAVVRSRGAPTTNAAAAAAAGAEADVVENDRPPKKIRPSSSSSSSPTSNGNDNDGVVDFDADDADVPAHFRSEATGALVEHFGHASFRSGQLAVLDSVMSGRDTCVFWATGAGKSLCYQLPPLHLNQVAIVVSPLISLMEDQVAKLNGRFGGGSEIATFLGSSQPDPAAEGRALAGAFRLVYVTPEKLTGGDGTFLEGLANMHSRGGGGRICLFAVDESHCVSEWGHDFRPAFLRIGPALRGHPALRSVPVLALTATAVPRVRDDILSNLKMNRDETTIVKRSFDRSNLKFVVRGKPRGGISGAFEGIASELARALIAKKGTTAGGGGGRSTIVYCATKKEVDDVTAKIAQLLAHQLVLLMQEEQQQQQQPTSGGSAFLDRASALASAHVRAYHAGLANTQRTESHTGFLVGRVSIVVATVAFGMGIDKPDIRRVVHWGAPKTVEEYYQQAGRAGRDGLPAECTMFAESGDFAKYKDEFYLGGLSGKARAATVRSMDALRDFAMSTSGCRRAALLDFFEEKPLFGKYCGTCDLCLGRKDHGDDYERDFQWEGARVILAAVFACPNQSMTTLETIIKGGTVESYRYDAKLKAEISHVPTKITCLKERMKKKKPIEYFKGIMPSLVDRGYLRQITTKSKHEYARNYLVYDLTSKGKEVLIDGPIVIPVPPSVREQEKLEEEKTRETLAELKKFGVDFQNIPQAELESGDGEAITAYKRWYSYVDSFAARGRTDMVDKLDDMKSRIEAWRMDMAVRYRMAPASVMEEHLLVKIAYITASFRAGTHTSKDALIAAGVRSNGIDELTSVLNEWVDEAHKDSQNGANESEGNAACVNMVFKPGQTYQPGNSWRFALYKPNKKTGKAAWELSYDRFVKGEHPQTIAMTQAGGKPIQVATVVGHILDALTYGRAVDLHRLSDSESPPTKSEWDELVRCSVETDIDVTGDPASSGPNNERFSMKDFLIPVMGNAFALKDYKDRTPEESTRWNKWCGYLKWYLALLRAGYEPTFGSDS